MKRWTVSTAFALAVTNTGLAAQTTTPAPVAPLAARAVAPSAPYREPFRPLEFQRNVFFARPIILLFADFQAQCRPGPTATTLHVGGATAAQVAAFQAAEAARGWSTTGSSPRTPTAWRYARPPPSMRCS